MFLMTFSLEPLFQIQNNFTAFQIKAAYNNILAFFFSYTNTQKVVLFSILTVVMMHN